MTTAKQARRARKKEARRAKPEARRVELREIVCDECGKPSLDGVPWFYPCLGWVLPCPWCGGLHGRYSDVVVVV